jgi:CheY-like chemotaxis protein/MinD-like ATPase involved in chromosome partitioning or flagellar assembly
MADKVLIVDDDVQTLRLVGLMLERQGYKILAANSGAQALQMAHSDRPDVIVLDVMMPDMDGYEVTRRLRKDQETANIPILMFTAKTMVEDKVSGYEAGADDYLTKPIHPAELTAHLRALLSRSKSRSLQASNERGYTIGIIAAKGGLGTSTLALNLAIAYHQKTKSEVIAAELRPGQGTWANELGNNLCDGLNNLLRMRASDISPVTVENELVRLPYGIRLLMASSRAKDSELMTAVEQLEAVVDGLPVLAKLSLLDIGTGYIPGFEMLLNHCNELMVVTEPFPATVQRTRALLDELGSKGFGRSKIMTIVSINRIRADVQLSMVQMQEMLGVPVSQVIPPAPEIAFQAANRNIPLIQMQIGGVISQQIGNLAERLIPRIQA